MHITCTYTHTHTGHWTQDANDVLCLYVSCVFSFIFPPRFLGAGTETSGASNNATLKLTANLAGPVCSQCNRGARVRGKCKHDNFHFHSTVPRAFVSLACSFRLTRVLLACLRWVNRFVTGFVVFFIILSTREWVSVNSAIYMCAERVSGDCSFPIML